MKQKIKLNFDWEEYIKKYDNCDLVFLFNRILKELQKRKMQIAYIGFEGNTYDTNDEIKR